MRSAFFGIPQPCHAQNLLSELTSVPVGSLAALMSETHHGAGRSLASLCFPRWNGMCLLLCALVGEIPKELWTIFYWRQELCIIMDAHRGVGTARVWRGLSRHWADQLHWPPCAHRDASQHSALKLPRASRLWSDLLPPQYQEGEAAHGIAGVVKRQKNCFPKPVSYLWPQALPIPGHLPCQWTESTSICCWLLSTALRSLISSDVPPQENTPIHINQV